jgi:replication initiation and membrane attachment protein
MKIIEPDSRFALHIDFSLSPTDEEVLSFLYLPIIKAESFALYHSLYSLSCLKDENPYFLSSDFLGYIGMDEGSFLRARSGLEAIGLLSSFRKEEALTDGSKRVTYLYAVLPPASPRKFFADILLRACLSSAVGGKKYNSLKGFFKVTAETVTPDYSEVSAKFRDVFSPTVGADDPSLTDDSPKIEKKEYASPVTFSREKLLSALSAQNYDVTLIQGQLDDLIQTASLYGASESVVADLIGKDTDTDHVFYPKDFLRDLRNLTKYQRRNSASGDGRIHFGDSDTSRFLKAFNDLAPKELLATLIKAEPAAYMLTEIENLKRTLDLPNPVLNVVLDYSIRECHGEFNNLFIEKVAYSVNANGISDSYGAMVFLNTRDFGKNQSQRKRKTKPDEKGGADGSRKLTKEQQDALLKDIDI